MTQSEVENLLPLWLRNARDSANAKSQLSARAFDTLKNKDNKYAQSIATMRDLHAQCAEIFANALKPFEE